MARLTTGTAAQLARGGGRYLADLRVPGCLEAAFVRSPLPHARVRAARFHDGRGLAAADLGLAPLVAAGPGLAGAPWIPLGGGRARYVGEPLAVVWAADRYQAEDLVDAAQLELEALPDDQPLHAQAPTGVLFETTLAGGDLDAALGAADAVLEGRFRCARQTPFPLETRGVLAHPDPDTGVLTVWTSTQIPDLVRSGLAQCLGLPAARLRVRVPHVGGGFGVKAHLFAEEVAVAALALRLGQPVRWIEDRQEHLAASAHAHDMEVRLRVGISRAGRFLGVDADLTADVGAYSIWPFSASLEPMTAASSLFGAYQVAALRCHTRAVASTRCPVGAQRGVGVTVGVHATERMVDQIARHLGLDPLELRRRNAGPAGPWTSPIGRAVDSGDYPRLLTTLATAAGYDALRAEQRGARAAGRLLGVGLALFNEHSGTGTQDYRRRGIDTIPGWDQSRVRVLDDGRIEIATSAADAGQGHADTYRRLAAQELGVAPERVEVVEGDTDRCPPGTGTFTSRGAVGVLESLVQALRAAAATDLAPGTDIVRRADAEQVYPSGAHLAVVEVDPVGWQPRVLRYVAVEDCGTIVHPEVVAGQVRGGVAMGIGNVLLEEHAYDADGQIQTTTLLDYLVPLATDVPGVELHHLTSPSPRTTLGSKGVGEAGTIGAFGAVANAVADAVAPLGAELDTLPYSPQRIFAAVERARAGRSPEAPDR
ncbi:MAG TPA: xanthine dehydrogenase family protein molybdopterin-binding subunit [Candidatus Dormibacteraeota bacterium]|nr:xanthine dehydrogenase family protein molybdopterin-binding subunit [Candidatus Dormibacteraeota bacterium]